MIIPNFSYRKEKLSMPLRNKDFYLFNLLHKKNIEKNDFPKITNNENNNNNQIKRKRKLMKLKELSTQNYFNKVNIKYKNQEESFKNLDNNFKSLFFKNKNDRTRYNSNNFISKDQADKFESSNKINNFLVITSLNRNNKNDNSREKRKTKKNKLTKIIKRSFTYKSFNDNDLKKFDEDYFISNSIPKNSKIQKKEQKNESTQINLNNNNFIKHQNTMTIRRNKYCSPRSIIFQSHFRKFKSLDNNRYISDV